MRLIREESAVSGGSEMLSARLDAVSSTLTETSLWMDQNTDLFSALEGHDELSATLPTLPQAPSVEPPPVPPPPRKKQREG